MNNELIKTITPDIKASVLDSVSDYLASSTVIDVFTSNVADKLATSTSSFINRIVSTVMDSIKSTGEWIASKITATLAIFNRVETQTAAVKKGLEITDQATGSIYCVTIENGDWKKNLGSCDSLQATTTPQIINNNTPAPAPAGNITPVVTEIVSTPVVSTPEATSTPIISPTPVSATSTPDITPTPSSDNQVSNPVSTPITPENTPQTPVVEPVVAPDSSVQNSNPTLVSEPVASPVEASAPAPTPAPVSEAPSNP